MSPARGHQRPARKSRKRTIRPPPSSLKPIDRLLAIMRILRSPGGCPWDREQSFRTLKPHLIEESYETIDAIDSGDRSKLAEELGDVLLQVVFHAQIASEERSFTFDDVARLICEKLIRRHPHVFGEVRVSGAAEVLQNWEKIKRTEKEGVIRSAVAGVPRHLPALHKAQQVQKRAARVGFDWNAVHQVVDKIDEEIAEVKQAMAHDDSAKVRGEIGDLLFATVNLSRFLGHDAEEALDQTVAKFVRRFQEIERRLHEQGRRMTDCNLAELDAIWDDVKRTEVRSQRSGAGKTSRRRRAGLSL
jgi:tetrapyrrole methylase family protein / MazG family protein